jgi:hypothetical protein
METPPVGYKSFTMELREMNVKPEFVPALKERSTI